MEDWNGPAEPPMDALEASSPDRYRYAFQGWTRAQKAKGHGHEESFPTRLHLPVREIQERLQSLVQLADIREEQSLVF
jgi:hypothetical protein